MDNWQEKLNQGVAFVKQMTYWEWGIAALIVFYVFHKPIKRLIRKRIRKVTRFILRIVRLYFMGI